MKRTLLGILGWVSLAAVALSLIGFGVACAINNFHFQAPQFVSTSGLSDHDTMRAAALADNPTPPYDNVFSALQGNGYTPIAITTDRGAAYLDYAHCGTLSQNACLEKLPITTSTPIVSFRVNTLKLLRPTGAFRLIYPAPKDNDGAYTLVCREANDFSQGDITNDALFKDYDNLLVSDFSTELNDVGQKFESHGYPLGNRVADDFVDTQLWQCEPYVAL